MQQQIQVQRNDEINNLQLIQNEIARNNRNHFEIINDQELIQEVITQNYQQDFDSISNSSQHHNINLNQIDEDLPEIQENIIELQQSNHQKSNSILPTLSIHDQQSQKLKMQCEKMRVQIILLTEQINAYCNQDQKQPQSIIKFMQSTLRQNNQTLQAQQLQQMSYFQTKFGKDSFCIQDNCSPQDFQQKIITQIEKLKMLINMSNLQIAKIKRQTKRYEETLPLEETNKQQFYQNYNKLKKKLDDMRQKYESQQKKQNDLDEQICKLKQKLNLCDIPSCYEAEIKKKQSQQIILNKYQELVRLRQNDNKKNSLIMHQFQNNAQTVNRGILQLRKQNNQIEQKIDNIDQASKRIEQASDQIMKKYDKIQQKKKVKEKQKKMDQFIGGDNTQISSPSQSNGETQIIKRRKYNSQNKNSFVTSIFNHVIFDKEQKSSLKPTQSIEPSNTLQQPSQSPKIQLAQSSTKNTIKKFKLKLPSQTPQKSIKNLNISLDISKPILSRGKAKSQLSKLSISQRLQRIEKLEKQDKIHSHKLYQMKNKEDEKTQVKRQILPSLNQAKQSISVNELPNYQKQMIKQMQDEKGDIISNLSCMSQKPTRQSVEQNSDSQINLNQNSLVQKLEIQQLNLSNSQISNRMNQRLFKKRIIYRQKKISQDYMKILQQRGRKILQLDDQSQS